jgi:hypothetical protein
MKSLTVHFSGWNTYDYSRFWEDITIILLHAPNLAAFSSADADVTISALALKTLSTVASFRLSRLCVCFNERNPASMHLVTRFPSLQDLKVEFAAEIAPDFADVKPWIIPTVRTFSWRYDTPDGSMDSESLWFLSACRFASQCRISLNFFLEWSDESVVLNPFFNAHHDAETINLYSWSPITESSTIFSIQDVKFEASLPPAILFIQDRLPKRVSLRVDVESVNGEEGSLWRILDVLESRRKPKQNLILRLWLASRSDIPCPAFSWHRDADRNRFTTDYISFVGRLLPRALRLYSRGIIIVDESGEEVHAQIPDGYKGSSVQAA